MRKILSIFVFLSLSLSGQAFSECNNVSCDHVKIHRLMPVENGIVYVLTTGDESLLTNCTATNSLELSNEAPGFDAIFATILANHLQNTVVERIRVGPNSDGKCKIDYLYSESDSN